MIFTIATLVTRRFLKDFRRTILFASFFKGQQPKSKNENKWVEPSPGYHPALEKVSLCLERNSRSILLQEKVGAFLWVSRWHFLSLLWQEKRSVMTSLRGAQRSVYYLFFFFFFKRTIALYLALGGTLFRYTHLLTVQRRRNALPLFVKQQTHLAS